MLPLPSPTSMPSPQPSPSHHEPGVQLLHELEALSQALHRTGHSFSGLPPPRIESASGLAFASSRRDISNPGGGGGGGGTPPPPHSGVPFAGVPLFPPYGRHSTSSIQPNPLGADEKGDFRARFSTSVLKPPVGPRGSGPRVDIRARNDQRGAPQLWQSQSYDKQALEVENFPECLQDNIIFSSKLEVPQEKKSFWKWKPFRALAHIGQQRFTVVFSVHVHSIDGLPTAMNGLRLAVLWRRKEEGVQTMPCRVFQGVAEFEETLRQRCTVYGSKSPNHGIKYEAKFFTLSVVALDAEELDFGKYRLDLSRMLPQYVGGSEEDDKPRSWATSFKLTGKAKGGSLVVTFGFSLVHQEVQSQDELYGNSSTRFGSRRSMRGFNSLPNSAHGSPFNKPSNPLASPTLSEPGAELESYLAMEHLSLDGGAAESPSRISTGDIFSRPSDRKLSIDTGLNSLFEFKPVYSFFPQDDSLPSPTLLARPRELIDMRGGYKDHDGDYGSCEDEVDFIVEEKGVEVGSLSGDPVAVGSLSGDLVEDRSLSFSGIPIEVGEEEGESVLEQQNDEMSDEQKQAEQQEDSLSLAKQADFFELDEAEETGDLPLQGFTPHPALHELRSDESEVEMSLEQKQEEQQRDSLSLAKQEDFFELDKAEEAGDLPLEGFTPDRGLHEVQLDESEGEFSVSRQMTEVFDHDAPQMTEILDHDSPEERDGKRGLEFDGSLEEDNEVQNSQADDLDDELELVAGEFFQLFGNSPSGLHSDSEGDSPRAQLLKQFEYEALLEGRIELGLSFSDSANLQMDDSAEEHFLRDSEAFSKVSGSSSTWGYEEGLELASFMEAAESELQKATQTLRSKTRARMLEDAETEALMQQWGLDEKAFESSFSRPPLGSDNPMTTASMEIWEPPPLSRGLGTVIKMRNGESFRSMSPRHFQKSKAKGRLVMQVSRPVVVPTGHGSSAMDVLRCLASCGVENMVMQAMAVMPLEDLTGKTLEEIAAEGIPEVRRLDHKHRSSFKARIRYPSLDASEAQNRYVLDNGQVGNSRKRGATEMQTSIIATGWSSHSGFGRLNEGDSFDDCAYLEEIPLLAMQNVEALAIDGLKVQVDMAEEDAPSYLDAAAWGTLEDRQEREAGGVGASEGVAGMDFMDGLPSVEGESKGGEALLSMAISLEEWLKLDVGVFDEAESNEKTLAILVAHNANHSTLAIANKDASDGGKGRHGRGSHQWGIMGNTLMIAMLVQLRDPFRNYEPVGAPMMALVQAERVSVSSKENSDLATSDNEEEEDTKEDLEQKQVPPQFKISGVHLAGLKTTEDNKKKGWGNQKQIQSGSRWLITHGMGKTFKYPLLNSKPVPANAKVKPGDTLWSISARVSGTGEKWKEMAALNSHRRNPDVIFCN